MEKIWIELRGQETGCVHAVLRRSKTGAEFDFSRLLGTADMNKDSARRDLLAKCFEFIDACGLLGTKLIFVEARDPSNNRVDPEITEQEFRSQGPYDIERVHRLLWEMEEPVPVH